MSIKSTVYITRHNAIKRIKDVTKEALNKDYRSVARMSFEDRYSVESFINNFECPDIVGMEKWTDKMIEDVLDLPFFRWSMFDNYLIRN